jgi:hypothetical protein
MLRYRFRGIQVGFKSERKATQEAGAAGENPGAGPEASADDNVQDVNFEEVKEDETK